MTEIKKSIYVLLIAAVCIIAIESVTGQWWPGRHPVADTRESAWDAMKSELADLAGGADVVFVGDSTVRGAIDPEVFEQSAKLSAVNLGMTGDFITYGDYAALRSYLRRHKKPKYVVVWHTVDVWPRQLDATLFVYTRPPPVDLLKAMSLALNIDWSLPLTSIFRQLLYLPHRVLHFPVQHGLMASAVYRKRYQLRDYLPAFPHAWVAAYQSPSTQQSGGDEIEDQAQKQQALEQQNQQIQQMYFMVSEESDYWFSRLAALCKKYDIQLILGRSPVHAYLMNDAETKARLSEINEQINQWAAKYPGVTLLFSANPVFSAEMGHGDKDHVNDLGRRFISRLYGRSVRTLHKRRAVIQ